MQKLYIDFADVGVAGFEFLENASSSIDVIKDGSEFWLRDVSTGARILEHGDILEIQVTEDQGTALKLRFGEKITNSV